MYSISDLNSVLDVVVYTVKAMKEVGYMPGDIEDYLNDAIPESNYYIIQLSKEKLEECNNAIGRNSGYDFDDTWRDHYYSSIWEDDDYDSDRSFYWDDDGRYDDPAECNLKHYWDDDNAVDDVETAEEKEAYEGFSSCKNHYWDSSDSEDSDDLYDKHGVMYDPWDDIDDNL